METLAGLPWYVKAFFAFGGAALLWKVVQGAIPKLLSWLMPLALKATDAFVAVILAQPLLRWFVMGNKENFLKTVNPLLDGLEDISDAVQLRLAKDLEEASKPQEAPPAPQEPPKAPR